jgi:hypothetical protein
MTKSGYQDKVIKNLLAITLYVPLIIAFIASGMKLYDFIYPATEGKNISEQVFDLRYNLSNSLMLVFRKIFGFLATFSGLLWSWMTDFKTLSITILVVYLILSYIFTFLYKDNSFLKSWSSYTNIILILGAAFISLGVISLFIKENNDSSPYPYDKSTMSQISWTFKETLPLYKSVLSIAIVLGLTCLALYLIKTFSFLSLSLTVIIEIAVVIGLIFAIFSAITKNTELLAKIMSNNFFKLLYHIIFIIPCTVLYLTNYIWDQIKETPYVSWIILIAEIVFVGLYFLIPIIKNYLFLHSVTKTDDLMIQQESEAHDKSIIRNENQMSRLMDGVSVDWDFIFSNNLYEPDMVRNLTNYLESRGYQSIKNKKQLGFFQKMFSKSISLEAAVTYVQINAPIIINLRNQIQLQTAESKDLGKNRKIRDNMLKTKILLKDPVYLSKKKVIGNYEDIGSGVGAFNYNYSISAWTFIHEQPPSLRKSSNKFTNIIDYANKPKIQFNPSTNTLRIIMSNGLDQDNVVYETTDFNLQRWNNIVVNYDGGTLDIFINGTLVSSTNNIVPIMSYDEITAGENEGLSGGVCSVVYFPKPLTLSKIKSLYKSLKYKNPPII